MLKAIGSGLGGVIVVALGRAAATGRLPRNMFAGIRIPSTLRSDDAWYAGHRAAATALTVAGLGPIAVATVVVARGPQRETEVLLSRMGTAWLLSWIGIATLQASRAARTTEAV
jgi:hypothetical protein